MNHRVMAVIRCKNFQKSAYLHASAHKPCLPSQLFLLCDCQKTTTTTSTTTTFLLILLVYLCVYLSPYDLIRQTSFFMNQRGALHTSLYLGFVCISNKKGGWRRWWMISSLTISMCVCH